MSFVGETALTQLVTKIKQTFLPLAGGTISGNLTVSGTITGNVTGNLTGTASGNLPLTGGTMTGAVNVATGVERIIERTDTDGRIVLSAGSTDYSGQLILYGADYNFANGWFLRASDGTNTYDFRGTKAGSLLFRGKEVERVDSSGSNYIRYVSGLQICWGYESNVTTSGKTITYPVAFNGSPRIMVAAMSKSASAGWLSNSTTGVKLETSATSTIGWLAIGFWS